ncbi:MAG: hypothetical protein K2R98_11465 [Gemmataceae bacterium]|nr:hypothetical protein [Gemmataceae bacterium]
MPQWGGSEAAMFVDRTHWRWLIGLVLLSGLATAIYASLPASARASSWQGIALGLVGTALAMVCASLPVRRRLQRRRRLARWCFATSAWEKAHIYAGLLGVLILHYHAGFRVGSPLTAVLLGVLWAIFLSGLAGLLFRHLLPLVKNAKEGKALLAGQIIGVGHALSLQLHIPLTLTLLALAALHAIMSVFY